MADTRPEKTAFVFAGGGSLGAIQVGTLRALVRAGIEADFVVGSSVGALNACFFAQQPDLDGVAKLEDIWRGLKRSDVFPFSWSSALNWMAPHGSVFPSDGLRRIVETHLTIRNLKEAQAPVHVVATNLSGAPVCFSEGPAVEAVLASAAIPIAYPAVRIGEDHFIDGAISGNTPILTAAERGATRIIVLQTGYACALSGPPPGAVARGVHALTLLISNQLERDLRLVAGQAQVCVAPHLCPLDVSPFNFDHSAALIERAADIAERWIAEGGLDIFTAPHTATHRWH